MCSFHKFNVGQNELFFIAAINCLIMFTTESLTVSLNHRNTEIVMTIIAHRSAFILWFLLLLSENIFQIPFKLIKKKKKTKFDFLNNEISQ